MSQQEEMSVPLEGVSLTREQVYYVGFWDEVESLLITKLAATPIHEELERRDRSTIGRLADANSSDLGMIEPMTKEAPPKQTMLDRPGFWAVGVIIVFVLILLMRVYARIKSPT